MKIVMFTNTFTPHVGGVARSVRSFTDTLRARGHRVVVVAPKFEDQPEHEEDVVRIPAVQHFNGSDFSVPLPAPYWLQDRIEEIEPDVVHAHHPFLLGDTALRLASAHDVPVAFTNHTRYEDYTHYVPGDLPGMKRFVIELASGYADLCDAVIAPSESIRTLLLGRSIETPIHVVPTGVELDIFREGDGAGVRRRAGVPEDAFVVGHVGRLAQEKNLVWLAGVLAHFLAEAPDRHLIVGGSGPSERSLTSACDAAGVRERLHLLGTLDRRQVADCYHAMDAFAFASHTETQGLVIAEAMAAGVPVVALDAPGVREVVRDGVNGRLLAREDPDAFLAALSAIAGASRGERRRLQEAALETGREFSEEACTARLEQVYEGLTNARRTAPELADSPWDVARRRIEREWEIWKNVAGAAVDAMGAEDEEDEDAGNGGNGEDGEDGEDRDDHGSHAPRR